jgi:O-antigen/teichoic acid export membrane protein
MAAHPVARILVSLAVIQASLFLSGVLVVRAVGVEARGELALISGVVGIASQMGLLGLPAALVYFIAGRRVPALAMISRVAPGLALRIVVCAVISVVALLILDRFSQPLSAPVGESIMVLLGITVLMLGFTLLAGLQGEERHLSLTIIQALPLVVYAGLVVLLVMIDRASIVTLLLANVTGWILVPMTAIPVLRRGEPRPGRTVLPTAAEVRRFGARAWVAAAGPTDMLGIDQVLIGVTVGHSQLGLYVIGWAFETGTVLPGVALATFLGPRVAAAEPGERIRLARRWLIRGLLIAALVCLLVELALAPLLVLAFGEEARAAIGPARILLVAGVFLGLRRALAAVLQALGRPSWATAAETVSFVVMVIGMLGLGSVAGIGGCAVAMALAGLVGVLVQVGMLRRLCVRLQRQTQPASDHAEES